MPTRLHTPSQRELARRRRNEALYWCAFMFFIALVFALRILAS